MESNVNPLRLKAFVSFAGVDRAKVKSLVTRLTSAGIPTWFSSSDVTPGTPDWESAIRRGMQESFAVVLVASPSSQRSQYVRAEITLAKNQNLKIFPVWIDGDQWSDCVSLDLIYSQYIDCRNDKAIEGVEVLKKELLSFSESCLPPRFPVPNLYWKERRMEKSGESGSWGTSEPPPGYLGIIVGNVASSLPRTGRVTVEDLAAILTRLLKRPQHGPS
jgi:TIR domain